MEIFIKGNVPSLKNSKEVVRLKNGRTMLLASKTVRNYLAQFEYQWADEMAIRAFKEATKGIKPVRVGFYFVRDTKRKFDLINIAQLPQDLMVKHGWLEDDNMDELVPVFLGYEVDENNPGVRMEVL